MNVLTLLMSFMASVKNGAAAAGVPVKFNPATLSLPLTFVNHTTEFLLLICVSSALYNCQTLAFTKQERQNKEQEPGFY
jgi:hypothetical protein